MQKTRCVATNTFFPRTKPLVLAFSAFMAMCSTSYAAQLGHARIVSQQNQPLRIAVQVSGLTPAEQQSFHVSAAPLSAWKKAGLIPPVDPATLVFRLVDGARANVKSLQISSSQPLGGPVADLLLEVQTASGRQQYQVSVLAPARAGAPVSSAAGSGNAGPGQAGMAQSASQAIRVRRGDTLFSIARRHAVPGVSVYQMMIALQRANPQAFIHGNINLVKAGATLQMPGSAELTAISDKEARRLFERQAQEFDAYRQGLAARKGHAVEGGSASRGRVSAASSTESGSSAGQAGDKVVLSGSSSSDKAADERAAAGKNLEDAQGRVSQLEQNVKNLNLALQSQGEAAKNAVLDGAAGIGQTVSDAADGITDGAGSSAGGKSAGEAASAASAPPGAGGKSATASGASAAGSPAAGEGGGAGPAANAAPAQQSNTVKNAINKAGRSVSWFQEHLLGVVTALLALVVLIIAWVLRRANAARDDDDRGAPITEAMVKEQLEKINLDLSESPEPPSIKS
jgi:pilus assembly protein FimV